MKRSHDLWLEQDEFLRRSGFSLRTLQRMVSDKQVKTRHAGHRSRNGRDVVQYAASCLPANAQLLLTQERIARSHIPETQMSVIPHPETHADRQISLFISPPAIPEDVRLTLSVEQNEIAQRRLEAISPLREFFKKSNGYKPSVRLQDGRTITSLRDLTKYLAQQHAVSDRTIWRWHSRFKEHGFPGLADDIRSDKGLSRFFRDNAQFADFAQAKYLVEGLSIRRVHETLVRECGELKIEAPHYDTVRAYLNNLPSPLTTMAREGETEFHKRCAPYILPDYASMLPNDEWVCDHAQHDVWVLNDCLAGERKYVPVRPYVTVITDMRTRAVLAAVWCINPSSETISTALRKAILKHGLPKKFYCDNGKDFVSHLISGVLVQLGIEQQRCIPRHPQSKNIERFFGTMHERFDGMWGHAYCGTSPATRPDSCDMLLKEHDGLVKAGKAHQTRMKLASDFIAICNYWMENKYNLAPHGGRGMRDKRTGEHAAPMELFERLLPVEQRRLMENEKKAPHALDALFWKVEDRIVSEGGCVQIDNERYQPADAQSHGALFMEIERHILVARDPNDMGRALALNLDRDLIGYLECQRLVARGPVAKDDIADSMRKQRSYARVAKAYINSLVGRYETELDHMRRAAGLPTPEGMPQTEVIPPLTLKKAVGFHDGVHIGDMVKNFLEAD